MSLALDLLLLATGWTHVLLAPYTKVEESFNLHATHDVLMYGISPPTLREYDHFVFPGAVPRTFIGSVLLAWISTPVLHIARSFQLLSTKFDMQIIVRLVLASINALGLSLLRRAVSRRFGRPTSLLFVLLTCSQFHIPFWMGRTLPNMFALFPVNVASYLLIDRAPNSAHPSDRRVHAAIALLTFTTVVFRSEVLLLLAPLVLQCLVLRHARLTSVIKTGLISGAMSLAFTVLIDSYFWDQWPLWPEFSGIYFNVFQGKSSEWGISPFHTYLTSHLPKLLLSSLPLSLLGAFLDPRIRTLLVPPAAFITLISCLGHKEWRFIIYAVPLFNVAAARGARWMISRRKRTIFGRLLFLALMGLLVANTLATFLLTRASVANYPGGEALTLFNQKYSNVKYAHVHISNLAAQTGASLFLQTYTPPYPPYLPAHILSQDDWTYNKTESLAATSLHSFTHRIAESHSVPGWRAVESVKGFRRWEVDLGVVKGKELSRLWEVLQMVEEEKLWILERAT